MRCVLNARKIAGHGLAVMRVEFLRNDARTLAHGSRALKCAWQIQWASAVSEASGAKKSVWISIGASTQNVTMRKEVCKKGVVPLLPCWPVVAGNAAYNQRLAGLQNHVELGGR